MPTLPEIAEKIGPTPAIDALVKKHCAADSLADLLNTHPNYQPSLSRRNVKSKAGIQRDREITLIANAFDIAAEKLGQSRRAWRG